MAKARVLTRSELAEHLGVDKKMVTKWERSGMPVHTRGRGVASQFRLREVRAWLKVREAKGKAAEKAKVREAKAAEKGRFPGCICRPRRGRNTRHAPGGGAGRRDVWRIGPRKRHRFSVYLSSDGSCGGGRMVGAGNLVDRSPDACDGRTQGQ